MTDRELLQDALDALTYVGAKDIYSDTIDALRARLAQPEPLPAKSKGALSHEENKQHNKKILDKFYEENAHLYKAQPEQEPVFWATNALAHEWVVTKEKIANDSIPLYTAPPQREWVGLTDEEAQKTFARHNCTISTDLAGILARAITAKLKEKNK